MHYVTISDQLESGGGGNVSSQLKKGILWQQRDKIFSRWKERFFVLTKDYLQCFKKGTSRITEMGGFIYGIRLTEVCNMYCLRKVRSDLSFSILSQIYVALHSTAS